ncbi:MAG: type II toxin-antitoxin system HipA family toxin [Alphaproteobacteria bacterium]|nr:type II toxin-antitoxin system HipA family toxin [Alphaproteobacteria bacterium]
MTGRASPILVHVELEGKTILVGRLWSHGASASFEYDQGWRDDPRHFAIEPALSVDAGSHHTRERQMLFGALSDSAPDRWGRMLIRRKEEREARSQGRKPRTLHEIDYLLAVDDHTRQGALRFSREPEGPYLAADDGRRVPPLIDLPKLLQAAMRLSENRETDEDLRILLRPGSSLGGARPKASVRLVDGSLAIAKFPQASQDDFDVPAWEAVVLSLARKAGLDTAASELKKIAGKNVLITKRFDRVGDRRIPFLSAMSMLEAADGEPRSYLEIADAIRMNGAAPELDLRELWRRIVFTVLVSNVDDHLRNHAFLHQGTEGWRLAPAYDINPVPVTVRARELTTSITESDNAASLDLALEVRERFLVDEDMATETVSKVAGAVSGWRVEAQRTGIPRKEIDAMASAFEHRDLEQALNPVVKAPAGRKRKSLSDFER